MIAPGEVVQEEPDGWRTSSERAAGAWLLSHVRTDVPGYRRLQGSSTYTIPSGEYRFDDLIAAMNGELTVEDPIEWLPSGRVVVPGELSKVDRLLWLLGRGDAGSGGGSGGVSFVPPAGIPLLGASWSEVETDADRRRIVARFRKGEGYVWGSARIWKCTLTLHRWALQALEIGWCLRGKVTLASASALDTPASGAEPGGAIVGHALGIDTPSWLGASPHRVVARVALYIVTEADPPEEIA